jgi:hypothetical protein
MNNVESSQFLNIYGDVAFNKRKEFEQTVRFIFNQLPPECTQKFVAADIFREDHYFFISTWIDEISLNKFLKSEEFKIVRGAYVALGRMDKIVFGPII